MIPYSVKHPNRCQRSDCTPKTVDEWVMVRPISFMPMWNNTVILEKEAVRESQSLIP